MTIVLTSQSLVSALFFLTFLRIISCHWGSLSTVIHLVGVDSRMATLCAGEDGHKEDGNIKGAREE
jgi:hypothetical protein